MISKEIGSEFWNTPLQDNDNLVFSDETKWFISGRAALDFILKDILSYKDIETVALPSWCCDSMIKPIIRNNLKPVFYSVLIKDNKLLVETNIEADVLLYMDYFGYKNDNNINFEGVVINDISHSVFCGTSINSNYTFGSLRKWAGFKTGGFAHSKSGFKIEQNKTTNNEYISLRQLAMIEKEKYINSLIDKKDYLNIYSKAEEMLEDLYDYTSIDEDIYCAKHVNIDYIKNKRQENAKTLLETVKEYAIFKEVKEEDCPLFVPIIVPNNKRNKLRSHLKNNSIFCPIHWPISELHILNKPEKFIYENELSLVCDQRYDVNDMKYVCEKIKEFLC